MGDFGILSKNHVLLIPMIPRFDVCSLSFMVSWFRMSPFVSICCLFVKASRDLRLCNDLHGWKLVTNENDHWKTQGPGIQQDPTHLHPLPWPWFRDDRRCFEYTFFFLHVLWKLNQTIECIRTDYYAFALLHRSGRTRTEPSCIYDYLPDTAAKALIFNSQSMSQWLWFFLAKGSGIFTPCIAASMKFWVLWCDPI